MDASRPNPGELLNNYVFDKFAATFLKMIHMIYSTSCKAEKLNNLIPQALTQIILKNTPQLCLSTITKNKI